MSASVIQLDQMTISGESRGGHQTWFKIQPPAIAFDVGHGPPALTGVRSVFLSHGHLDHAGGLPILLSQRALHGLGELAIHAPTAIVEPLREFLAAAARLEETEYRFRLRGLEAGDEVACGRDFVVRAFETSHVVPSVGFHLVQRVRRLAPRYHGRSPADLAGLRREGAPVDDREERLLVSYLGDTRRDVFDSEPALLKARILLVECTFLAPDQRERAERFGHLHFEDLVAVVGDSSAELIVLHHLSSRTALSELEATFERRLPEAAGRIMILGAECGD